MPIITRPMNNPSNIYDIDMKLIRNAGDTHEWTIEEAQERIKYYLELLKALSTDDPDYALKASVYNQYVDNLVSYTLRKKLYETKFTPEEPEELPEEARVPFVQIETPMKNDEQIDIVDLEPVDNKDKSVGETK